MVNNLNIREKQIKDKLILDKFSKLSNACHKYPALYLQGLMPALRENFDASEFVENHPKDGFMEKFCLGNNKEEKVKLYRLANLKKILFEKLKR